MDERNANNGASGELLGSVLEEQPNAEKHMN